MKIVCISDTHGHHEYLEIPEGDVLIHAGDFSTFGYYGEGRNFAAWLAKQPHKTKLLVAGNHDFCLEHGRKEREELLDQFANSGITYLEDSGCEVEGLKVYGTPWVPTFGAWAFMENEEKLAERYAKIPDDVDILITHGPAHFWKDMNLEGDYCGSTSLRSTFARIAPKLHVFGHIHESYGHLVRENTEDRLRRREFHCVNASSVTRFLQPKNAPIVIEL